MYRHIFVETFFLQPFNICTYRSERPRGGGKTKKKIQKSVRSDVDAHVIVYLRSLPPPPLIPFGFTLSFLPIFFLRSIDSSVGINVVSNVFLEVPTYALSLDSHDTETIISHNENREPILKP